MMSLLLFQGDLNDREDASLHRIVTYFHQRLMEVVESPVNVFRLAEANIPFFTPQYTQVPTAVRPMLDAFRQADVQLWFTPLYHGSMTGAMKNALDWLQFTHTDHPPYLSDRYVGLVSLSEGIQAMQAINAMDTVAKSLRPWVIPFSIPVQKSHLYDASGQLSLAYRTKFNQLTHLAVKQIGYAPAS